MTSSIRESIAASAGVRGHADSGGGAESADPPGQQHAQTTALNEAAEALRKSEQKLRSFAEMSAEWFWEQGADLRFQPHNWLRVFEGG